MCSGQGELGGLLFSAARSSRSLRQVAAGPPGSIQLLCPCSSHHLTTSSVLPAIKTQHVLLGQFMAVELAMVGCRLPWWVKELHSREGGETNSGTKQRMLGWRCRLISPSHSRVLTMFQALCEVVEMQW